jgi:hypothetical protein
MSIVSAIETEGGIRGTLVDQQVLLLVEDLARTDGGTVRLLHVTPIPQRGVDDHGRLIAYASHETERLESKGLDCLKLVIGG